MKLAYSKSDFYNTTKKFLVNGKEASAIAKSYDKNYQNHKIIYYSFFSTLDCTQIIFFFHFFSFVFSSN